MQTTYFSINDLKTILNTEQPTSIFLVRGDTSYETCGAKAVLEPLLKDYTVTSFSDFEINPKIEDIERGIALYLESGCDFVIAIGGGSALDVAKSICVLAEHDKDPAEYVTKNAPLVQKGSLLVAIPTTAGTGSESTHFAVVYIGKTKYSLSHQHMMPGYAILDAQFTMSLPPRITASTGLDALCQATEAFWSVNSTAESRNYSRRAITLLLENLDAVVNNPTLAVKQAVLEGANLAGRAINIAKTTACHSLSYPITSHFGVPHGHAVALTLGEMFVFNARWQGHVIDSRGSAYVTNMMHELLTIYGVSTAEEARDKLNKLMDSIKMERTLSALGISEEEHETILVNGFNPERMKNNPYKVDETAVRKILRAIA